MSIINAGDYNVFMERTSFAVLTRFLKKLKFSRVYLLCDENTLFHCIPLLVRKVPLLAAAEIIEIESGESSKSIDIASQIWLTLTENQADRSALLVNVGGGVVTDLGGFSASLYKRGIPFIHIPTSLLAMADASVGGKTAIDFGGVKNLIGSFSHPKAVFIFPEFLSTLSPRHYLNGLVEVYKIALVASAKLWRDLDRKPVTDLIEQSVKLKNRIVKADPFDHSTRKILNFGHSFGHAFEALSQHQGIPLLHGEAVLAGMIIETELSFRKDLISKELKEEIISGLLKKFRAPLLDYFKVAEVMSLLWNDKKSSFDKLRFSLLSDIGKAEWDVVVTREECLSAFQNYKALVNA